MWDELWEGVSPWEGFSERREGFSERWEGFSERWEGVSERWEGFSSLEGFSSPGVGSNEIAISSACTASAYRIDASSARA